MATNNVSKAVGTPMTLSCILACLAATLVLPAAAELPDDSSPDRYLHASEVGVVEHRLTGGSSDAEDEDEEEDEETSGSRPSPSPPREVILEGPGEVRRFYHKVFPLSAPASSTPRSVSHLEIIASRSFLYRHRHPPEDYAAYGIVAFPLSATSASRERHEMICEAYAASLPDSALLEVPVTEQMVTVWPVDDEEVAEQLRVASATPGGFSLCERAVAHYDILTAKHSINHARRAGLDLGDGRGPFLLAWSPSSRKGDPDAVVLYVDLSRYHSQPSINAIFQRWAMDIESNPRLWKNGWAMGDLRSLVRNWADDLGATVLGLIERGD
ncbi:hypothetical protein [Halomonas halodenitrificans]|uniref:hypothetical protein n=1 Tax=Halomonas halodenitrificans TaxID=28252 RepID=UPI0012EC819B|nr:hypothetical protein [Halomonas halodenitrificans]